MKKRSYEKLDGKTRILIDQANKLFRQDNQKGIGTRYRYRAAEERFCRWLSANTNVKKLVNVKAKHVIQYTQELKENGKSSATIKAELTSIRHYHNLTGSRETLPANERLDIPQVNTKGGVNRSWTNKEIEKAISLAEKMNRTDVVAALKLSYAFGCRIEETIVLTTKQIKDTFENKVLDLHNTKGNKPRGVGIGTASKYAAMQKRAIEYALVNAKSRDKIFVAPGEQTHAVKNSVQGWIYRHRSKFQDKDRIHRDAAREIAATARDNKQTIERPKAELTCHGLRHSFANNMYKEILQEKIQEHKENNKGKDHNRGRERDHNQQKEIVLDKEKLQELDRAARQEVSELLGHSRVSVTWVYIDGQWVAQIIEE